VAFVAEHPLRAALDAFARDLDGRRNPPLAAQITLVRGQQTSSRRTRVGSLWRPPALSCRPSGGIRRAARDDGTPSRCAVQRAHSWEVRRHTRSHYRRATEPRALGRLLQGLPGSEPAGVLPSALLGRQHCLRPLLSFRDGKVQLRITSLIQDTSYLL